MLKKRPQFWGGLAVGLLGLSVGISNLVRAFGDGPQTLSLIVGVVCTILATAWLVRIFLTKRTVSTTEKE